MPIIIKNLGETTNQVSLARIKNEPPHLVTLNSSRFSKPTTMVTNLTQKVKLQQNQQQATVSSIASSTQPQNTISISETTLNDILRQLAELKKQTNELQKQNDDYRIRLETLERERGINYNTNVATAHYTNKIV